MKLALLAVSLMYAACAQANIAVSTTGGPECEVVNPVPKGKPREKLKVTWSGACKEGYADGPGTVEWFLDGELRSHFEGSLKRGLMHGDGYWRDAHRNQYEGDFLDGEWHGKGIFQSVDLTRYEGEWRDSGRNGYGVWTSKLGSSYAGQWKAGKFHGQGKATYTSGKVIEGEFVEGLPAGQPAIAKIDAKTYTMSTHNWTDNNVKTHLAPFRKTWDAMSRAEQRVIRNLYANLLHEDDEPPYPANGVAQIYTWIAEGQHTILTSGRLRMNIAVDSSGTPSTVTVFTSPDPETTRLATFILMKEKFKPALCAGTPCAMSFPFSMVYSVE
jgi:hypothetical protein